MVSYRYSVYTRDDLLVAKEMLLSDALLLMRALMEQYYNEPELGYVIKRELHDA